MDALILACAEVLRDERRKSVAEILNGHISKGIYLDRRRKRRHDRRTKRIDAPLHHEDAEIHHRLLQTGESRKIHNGADMMEFHTQMIASDAQSGETPPSEDGKSDSRSVLRNDRGCCRARDTSFQNEDKNEIQRDIEQSGNDNWLVKYTKNESTGAYVPTFYNESVLAGATYDTTNTSVSYIGAYTKGSAPVSEEIKGVTAFMEQDATGRYINITMEDASGNLTTYSLTTSTVTDDDAYNDAMNQYEYDKAQYDQDIQEINAKIEIIQTEDKDLEIRLKQLDTEQDAISNEMDAVTKVIEKNVESSFKTFG